MITIATWLFVLLVAFAVPMAGIVLVLLLFWILEKTGYFKDDREGRKQ